MATQKAIAIPLATYLFVYYLSLHLATVPYNALVIFKLHFFLINM